MLIACGDFDAAEQQSVKVGNPGESMLDPGWEFDLLQNVLEAHFEQTGSIIRQQSRAAVQQSTQ